jgi:hypothetical protein
VLDKEATRRKLKHASGCRKSVSPVLLATLSGDTLNNKSVSPVLLATLSGDTLNDRQKSANHYLEPCFEMFQP